MENSPYSFKLESFKIPIERILPVRLVKDPKKTVRRYVEIVSSIREAGLIEPLMVYPEKGDTGNYLLTDGHLRLCACKELEMSEVDCIIAFDDESYTYNAKVNRLAPIQEQRMILKAIEKGVSVEKIAAALNMDIGKVRARMNLTHGLCPVVIDLLKDKQISPSTLVILRKVVANRQIEIVELMVGANNYSRVYAEALFLGTPKDRLTPAAVKKSRKINQEELGRMEYEMASLEREYKICEENFSKKMLQLTMFRRYAMRLLENDKIDRFLNTRHAEIHAELSEIVASETVC
ncbi:MAG: plasmid partitioning protein RepB C-terminal domain-containing protein [Verrucomicrobiales bacterium]